MGKVNAMRMDQMERDREELDRLWNEAKKYMAKYEAGCREFERKYGEEP